MRDIGWDEEAAYREYEKQQQEEQQQWEEEYGDDA